jgi:PAS domain S-box-containing protein
MRAAPNFTLEARGGASSINVPRALAVALGLAIAAGLALVDAVAGSRTILIGTVVLAPFVVSLLATERDTALVAAVALALALVSAAWNHNFSTAAFWLRVAVVLVGGIISVLAARARERTTLDRERFALLAAVAAVADGQHTLEESAGRVCALAVPQLADVCMIDVLRPSGLRRIAARVAGADAAALETQLMSRPLGSHEAPLSGRVAASGESQLLSPLGEEALRAGPRHAEDEAVLGALRPVSGIVVPLSARGSVLGVVTLLATEDSGRHYTPADQRFVEVMAGRAALALDNAGLFSELRSVEAQLTTALGNLAEAVTIQNRQGKLIYANRAAADLLGYTSTEELLAAPPGDVVDRYESFREDGSPLRMEDVPGRRVLAGEEPEPLVVRVIDKLTGEQGWRMTRSSAVRDNQGEITMVINVIADVTAVMRAEFTQRLLAAAGEALTSSLDYQETLQQVAKLCVPELADWCAVSLPDERRYLRSVAAVHTDPEKVALARRVGERYPVSLDEPGGAPLVFREGTSVCANEISDEMLSAAAQDEEHLHALRSLGMRAALLVPMRSGARSIGVLSLVNAESGRSFAAEDIALASELGRRAGTAVENARLYTERSNIARTLQASLLPEELPALPGWRAAALYRPAGDENRVGGDFYEAIPLSDAWMVVVGDVTGRGAQAAAMTALMRHTLRTAATLTGSAVKALDKLNRDLVSQPDTALCTAVCAVLRELDGEATAEIICAGHPLPLLVRGGAAEYVGRFGPLLGAYADEQWEPFTVRIRPGDVLVLYSDGVLDAVGAHDRFGPQRLQQALRAVRSASGAVERISEALTEFQVGAQADDTAVLALERVGALSETAAPAPQGEQSARPA